MEISQQVVKPLLDRITEEYDRLYRELRHHGSDEAYQILSEVQGHLNQLDQMNADSDIHLILTSGTNAQREALRELKLQLRFLSRRWKRHLTSENRLRRNREKQAYVPPVAA